MDETAKTKKLWGELEHSILAGKGIDIGCGADPITPAVRRFDVQDGDANQIIQYVQEEFDFVYSSHCLEHMRNPRQALADWWKLVRVGGHLVFLVPDEDLYEQGVFPSRFNSDHKFTFTISKTKSWSPVSINVLELARSLPGGQLISLALQDQGYDRRLLKHGRSISLRLEHFLRRVLYALRRQAKLPLIAPENLLSHFCSIDQTMRPDVLAQIQCIVKKTAPTA